MLQGHRDVRRWFAPDVTAWCRVSRTTTRNLDLADTGRQGSRASVAVMSTAPSPSRPQHTAAGPSRDGRPDVTVVTVVTSEACHFCEEAVEDLSRRADELDLTIIPAATPRGRELIQRHLPAMFPLVLIDGAFFSSGRLPRRKLDKVLAARVVGGVSS